MKDATKGRMTGHALRKRANEEDPTRFEWACDCGHPLGVLPVHAARLAWRLHKAAVPAAGVG